MYLGIFRRFLVWPSGQVWPTNFPLIALLRTLHETPIKETRYDNHNKRSLWEKFISNQLAFYFFLVFIQFIYCWFPLYIAACFERLLLDVYDQTNQLSSLTIDWIPWFGYGLVLIQLV